VCARARRAAKRRDSQIISEITIARYEDMPSNDGQLLKFAMVLPMDGRFWTVSGAPMLRCSV
jgi:hypothetical protein